MSTHPGQLAWAVLLLLLALTAALTVLADDLVRESGTRRLWSAVFALALTGGVLQVWAGLTRLIYLYEGIRLH